MKVAVGTRIKREILTSFLSGLNSAYDKLAIRPMGEYSRKSLPAGNWVIKEMVVVALEDGCSDGLDVWDVMDSDGCERSIYGVQIYGKVD